MYYKLRILILLVNPAFLLLIEDLCVSVPKARLC
jgi:hypothetical protein